MTLYPYPPPLCIVCRRFDQSETCAAYPAEDGGIPIEILDGRWDHRLSAPGDRGIRFDPDVGYEKDKADLWLDQAVNPETGEPLNVE